MNTPRPRHLPNLLLAAFLLAVLPPASGVAGAGDDPCGRPAPGSAVPEPADLRSHDGALQVDLDIRNSRAPDGSIRYCYTLPDGTQAPTLRLHPGDELVLRLHDRLADLQAPAPSGSASRLAKGAMCSPRARPSGDPCQSDEMSATSTNLHFHGMPLAPVCHQDDVLKTSVQAGDPPFEYRFTVPPDSPPGLYWYHPHIHGFAAREISGGASGALIIEGLERAEPAVASLPERLFIIRDQALLHPDAPPSKSEPVVPRMLIDRDGDAANNGTGFGRPARDLSLNFVPVAYPDYPRATIRMRPEERQLWRVINASAVTYLNLALVFGHTAQPLDVVAIDGVPLSVGGSAVPVPVTHLALPPAARAEFIVQGPPAGETALFVTRTVDTGQGGENDPNRALANVVAAADAPEPADTMPAADKPWASAGRPWLGDVAPVRVRRLFFSEKLDDRNNPNSATEFYITVDGQKPRPFDPAATAPDIVVRQGDVEDWIIENRSTELHAFHIHQIHFEVVDYMGVPVNEPFLRDTVNVPYFNGHSLQYPSVRLRMDFRDPASVGTFLFHCHLLEHEDGGMMGTVRVVPRDESPSPRPRDSSRATPRIARADPPR